LILVIIAAVVVLGAVYWFFLRDKGETATTTTRARAQAPATTRPATTTTKPGGAVQETFQIFEVKNPFQPLVAEGGAPAAPGATTPVAGGGTSGGGTSGGGTSGGGTSGGGTTGTTAPAGSQTPSTGPGAGTGSGGAAEPQPQPQGTRVAMLDAPFTEGGRRVANVRVGSTVYKVGDGDTFATSFRVVSLDANCGVFLFGDNRFTLCAGQEILK
jgi:hypothetical protein